MTDNSQQDRGPPTHTPLPWAVDPNDHTQITADIDGGAIAGIWDSNAERSQSTAIANAAFIVGAVNSHYGMQAEITRLKAGKAELLAALGGLLIAAVEVGGLPEYGQVLVARKAIARATETKPESTG